MTVKEISNMFGEDLFVIWILGLGILSVVQYGDNDQF
jgi:hypothetical protein